MDIFRMLLYFGLEFPDAGLKMTCVFLGLAHMILQILNAEEALFDNIEVAIEGLC